MQCCSGAVTDRGDADFLRLLACGDNMVVFAQVFLGKGEAGCAGDGGLLDRG